MKIYENDNMKWYMEKKCNNNVIMNEIRNNKKI